VEYLISLLCHPAPVNITAQDANKINRSIGSDINHNRVSKMIHWSGPLHKEPLRGWCRQTNHMLENTYRVIQVNTIIIVEVGCDLLIGIKRRQPDNAFENGNGIQQVNRTARCAGFCCTRSFYPE
jgi:hypothetical protein